MKTIFKLLTSLKSIAKHLSFAVDFIEQTETLIKKHYGSIDEINTNKQIEDSK
jgi:hypothetical protein